VRQRRTSLTLYDLPGDPARFWVLEHSHGERHSNEVLIHDAFHLSRRRGDGHQRGAGGVESDHGAQSCLRAFSTSCFAAGRHRGPRRRHRTAGGRRALMLRHEVLAADEGQGSHRSGQGQNPTDDEEVVEGTGEA